MAKFLEKLCNAIAVFLPKDYKRLRCHWSGKYSSVPPAADAVDINRKLDLVALKAQYIAKKYMTTFHHLKWLNVDIVGELKAFIVAESKFIEETVVDSDNKAFCVFASQVNCRFLPFPTIMDHIVHFSSYDWGAMIHSKGFNMHKHLKTFLHMFTYLTFGRDEDVGFDPTFKVAGLLQQIIFKNIEYNVKREVFRNMMIAGRATSCFFVK